MSKSSYAQAGVNIDAGNRATELMKTAVHATYTAEVLSQTGNFGGLYDIKPLKKLDHPVLVASTDGVGTKTKVAAKLGRWDTIGQDLVNHCVNDILVQGARPLFFLDYVASSQLDPEQIATIVSGVAHACREVGCALLGGETAEMPGVYVSGEIDLVGTVVGIVEHKYLIDGRTIEVGDAILNLPATGLHTNGYSLARHILADLDWTNPHPDLGQSIGEALLAVHRCYLRPVQMLWESGIKIKGLAHITGGGVVDNLPRILPSGCGASIDRGTWTEPAIFGLIQQLGQIELMEMFRTFNMGLGMLVILSKTEMSAALAELADGGATAVGQIIPDRSEVMIQ